MSTGPGAPTPLPSLEQVRHELDQEQESYARRASSLDTKIGVLIAADGVLLGFRPDHITLLDLVGESFAAVSALVLIWAFLPQLGTTVSPRVLRNAYITQPEIDTKLAVLDTRIGVHEVDEQDLKRKWKGVRWGVIGLGAAVLLTIAGSIVSYVEQGASSDQHSSDSTLSPPASSTSLPPRP